MTAFAGIEFHGWRGFARERDLFLRYQRVGFLTLVWSKESPTDALQRLIKVIERPHFDPNVRRPIDPNVHGDVAHVPFKGRIGSQ